MEYQLLNKQVGPMLAEQLVADGTDFSFITGEYHCIVITGKVKCAMKKLLEQLHCSGELHKLS